MIRFEVVTMAKETEDNLIPFCDYWTRVGASKIQIYFDGALETRILSGFAKVELIELKDVYWSEILGKPYASIEEKQRHVYDIGYKRAEADYCFILDADEIIAGQVSISEFLEKIPADVKAVTFPNAEMVYLPNDSVDIPFSSTGFRLPTRYRGWLPRVAAQVILMMRAGRLNKSFYWGNILGYAQGKQCLRTGEPGLLIKNHQTILRSDTTRSINVSPSEFGDDPRKPSLWVLHYDAVSYSRWKEKWRTRRDGETMVSAENSCRKNLQLEIKRTQEAGEAEMKKLFLRLYSLSKIEMWLLIKLRVAFIANPFADGSAIDNGGLLKDYPRRTFKLHRPEKRQI